MSEESDPEQSFTGASPWPLFVALGFALSELGVILGLRPVSVAGLLLFVSAVAGILTESGYISRPDRAIGIQGAALLAIGGALIVQNRTGTTVRGQSIGIAGGICLAAALVWAGALRRTTRPTETDDSQETPSD